MKFNEKNITMLMRDQSQEAMPSAEFVSKLKGDLIAKVKTEEKPKGSIFTLRLILPALFALVIVIAFVGVFLFRPSDKDEQLVDADLLEKPVEGEVFVSESLKGQPNVEEYLKKVGGGFVSDKVEKVPGRFSFKAVEGVTQEQVEAYAKASGGKVVSFIPSLNVWTIELDDKTQEGIPSNAIISSVEQTTVIKVAQVEPNDPDFTKQWGISYINAPEAWSNLDSRNKTILVAVVDTGVCVSHPDMSGKYVSGVNVINGNADVSDKFGHGCAVAGIISSIMNNSTGIAGVSPKVKILPIKAFGDDGSGTTDSAAAGIIEAANKGATIINLSFATLHDSQILEDAIKYAKSKGAIVVAAAGNAASSTPYYPASYDGVIGVGSLDQGGGRSWFSNFGGNADVYAPGGGIYTTKPGGIYGYVSGTSYAAAYVSGGISLELYFCQSPLGNIENGNLKIKAQNGEWDQCNPNRTPTVSSPAPKGPFFAGSKFEYQVVASDPDGDGLEFSLDKQAEGLSIDQTGKIVWNSLPVGPQSFNVIVTDGSGEIKFLISFTVENKPAPTPLSITRPSGSTPYCKYAGDQVWIYAPRSLDLWGFNLVDPGPSTVSGFESGHLINATIVGRDDDDPGPDPTPGEVVIYSTEGGNGVNHVNGMVNTNFRVYSGWYSFAVAKSNYKNAFYYINPKDPGYQKINISCTNL